MSKNLSALKSIAETLNQSNDLKEGLTRALAIILEVLDFKAGWVFCKQPCGKFRLTVHHGLPEAMIPPAPAWDGSCQCNRLMDKGKLVEAVNIIRCSRVDDQDPAMAPMAHHASVPLENANGPLGILNVVTHDGEPLDEEKLELLSAIANQMSVTIERGLLLESYRLKRLREQNALLKLSNALLTSVDLCSVSTEVVKVTADIFEADSVLLLLRRAGGDKLFRQAGTGLSDFTEEDLSNCSGPCSKLMDTGHSGHFRITDEGDFDMRLYCADTAQITEDDSVLCQSREWRMWSNAGYRSLFVSPIHGISARENMGILIVGHKTDRQTATDLHLTRLLANQAAMAIERSKLDEVRLHQKRIDKELEVAREIQEGFLPKSLPTLAGWEIAARYQSARHVGGDFYDLIDLPPQDLGIVIGDVAGKGVPAALVMALSRTIVRGRVLDQRCPEESIRAVNRSMLVSGRKDRFVSIFYGCLNTETGRFAYVRAGHNAPYHWRHDKGDIETLNGPGMVVGVTDNMVLEERVTQFNSGDVIVFFTDGLTEAMNAAHRDFSEHRLQELIRVHHHLSAEALAATLTAAVKYFVAGAPQSDDMTLVVLKRR